MLKGNLIHPDIMAALALCGHGDKVLIADGNYPLDSKSGDAERIDKELRELEMLEERETKAKWHDK